MTATATETTTWQLDPAHSSVEFAVKHLMIATVKGTFSGLEAAVTGAEQGTPTVSAKIDVATITTNNAQRDAHLRSPDFFDAEKYPEITFVSTRMDGDVEGEFKLTGDLTIRGVTRPITLDVTFEGRAKDPWGGSRIGYTAKGKLRRSDFGLTWNQALETGGVLVGEDIKISVEAQLVRK